MSEELYRQRGSYFSPASIRERYAHRGAKNGNDPLLDIARETVVLMRQNGKTDDEIRAELESKFHFDAETISDLLGE